MDDVFDLFCDLVNNLKSRSKRLRRQAIAAIGKVADRSCTNILVEAISSESDLEVRAQLIKTVGAVGTANLIPFLESFLTDGDARSRSNSVEALGRFPQEKDRIIPLLKPLINDVDNRVCGTAIKVLHQLGDHSGMAMLKEMLRGNDVRRRCTAVWAVGEMNVEDELATLVEYLGSPVYRLHTISASALKRFGQRATPHLLAALPDADRFRRAYIALSLGDVGGPGAVEALDGLLRDTDEMVILHALTALARLAAPQTLANVQALLGSNLPAVRAEAIKTLRCLGDKICVPAVTALMASETDTRVLSAGATLLGEMGSPEHIPLLKGMLQNEDSRVRANAIEALGCVGDRQIIGELEPFLRDADNRVFANTAIAMYEFGDVKVLDLLTERLRTGDERVRMSVAYALGEIELESVVTPLVQAVADQSVGVRNRVIQSLVKKGKGGESALRAALASEIPAENLLVTAAGMIGMKQSLGPLIERFLEKRRERSVPVPVAGNETRERIASLFSGLKDRVQSQQIHLPARLSRADGDVFAALRELAASDDPRLRSFAVYTFGELRAREAVGTALCLLQDPDDSVRALSAECLAKIGDWRTVRFLEGAMADATVAVKLHAARALGALGGPGSVRVLEVARGTAPDELKLELDAAIAAIRAREKPEAMGASA